jgi:hypothetical protein
VAVPEFEVFAVETALICTVTGAPLDGMMLFEMECGALYRPLEEIVPVVVLPPVTPLTCQVTALLDWPLMVAENCCMVKTSTAAALGETATVEFDGLVTVTVAEPDLDVFALEVAVTAT